MNLIRNTAYFIRDYITTLAQVTPIALASVYCHEMGHAIAMKTLFEDVAPSINMNLFNGNPYCAWGGPASTLTQAGHWLGNDYSLAAVYAAGPVTELALGALGFLACDKLNNSKIKFILTINNTINFVNPFAYACYDLIVGDHPGGDFARFKSLTEISSPIILLATGAIARFGLRKGRQKIIENASSETKSTPRPEKFRYRLLA